ncbi:MAG: ribosomal protein S18-alanine N-acetyltransferase [Clostridia bacterium]|nr:ribosomal protein S18-alanine N-acetyltransferase [Clostridia bacterium]
MDFRRSIPADAMGIAQLESEVFPDAWSYRDIQNLICSEGAMCFSAIDEGEVVAYVIGRLIAPEGEIYRVAVKPEKRKRGIAYRLLDYAVKTSRGKGLERLFLEVRSKNIPAINLYTAYGFTEIGVRKNYYKDPVDDAIVMLKAHSADMQF